MSDPVSYSEFETTTVEQILTDLLEFGQVGMPVVVFDDDGRIYQVEQTASLTSPVGLPIFGIRLNKEHYMQANKIVDVTES